MHSRWARFAAAGTVAVAVTAGSFLATAGPAAGSSAPIVIGSCAPPATVTGAPGTPLELSPSAVVQPIADLVSAVPLLGPPLAKPFTSAFAALPPIPIGALPTGNGTITGSQIATAVVAQVKKIPLLGPVIGIVATNVQTALTSACKVTVDGVNAVVAPVQQGASAVNKASTQAQQKAGLIPKSGGTSGSGGTPGKTGTGSGSGSGSGTAPVKQSGGTSSGSGLPSANSPVLGGIPAGLGTTGFGAGTLLDYGLAESPLARYAGIPFASAGLFDAAPGVKYGGQVPGYAPGYGVLGQDGSQNGTAAPDGVQTAGHAEALSAGGPLGNGVGLPMLLAVLMLAGVTAALVRTWVLRRTLPR